MQPLPPWPPSRASKHLTRSKIIADKEKPAQRGLFLFWRLIFWPCIDQGLLFGIEFVCYNLLMTKNIKNISGRRVGRLTVKSPNGIDEKGRYLWLCICDCGKEKTLPIQSLAPNGNTGSCGCLRVESNRKPRIRKSVNVTHGESSYIKGKRTSEYNTWLSMRQRCNDSGSSNYKNYGAKGVKVCDRWDASFFLFLEDMGRKPFNGASIDRIDVHGNYEPSNCRWANSFQQQNNRSNNRYAIFSDNRLTVAEMSRKLNIPGRTIHTWLDKIKPEENIEKFVNKRLSRP